MSTCDSYYNYLGKYQQSLKCPLYCCGICKDRYCCMLSAKILDQTTCNDNFSQTSDTIFVSTTFFFYFIMGFCLCCCCLLLKKRRQTSNPGIALNFSSFVITKKIYFKI